MSSNVVGRAVVRIDGEVDTAGADQAAADLERIIGGAAVDVSADVEQAFGGIDFDIQRELGGFSEQLDAVSGSVREFGGGFGDLVTGMETFGLASSGVGAEIAASFEKIEAGTQIFGGISDIVNTTKAGYTALAGSTNLMAGAQAALNVVMSLNPIVLVVAAIAGLVAALVIAYKKSETFRAIVDRAFKAVKQVVSSVIGFVSNLIRAAWNGIKNVTSSLASTLRSVFNGIKSFLTTVFNVYKTVAVAAFNGIKSVVTSVINGVSSTVRSVLGGVKTFFTTTWDSIKRTVTGAFDRIKSAVRTGIDNVVSTVRGLPGRITGALGNIGSLLFDKGKAVVDGLIRGIGSMASALRAKAADILGPLARLLPGSPVKEGPLTVLNNGYAGRQIAAMIAQGMDAGRHMVAGAGEDLAGAAVPGVGGRNAAGGQVGPGGRSAAGGKAAGGGTVVQHFHGPQTGREITQEMTWAMRFAT